MKRQQEEEPASYAKVKKVELTRRVFAEFFKESNYGDSDERELIEITDGLPDDAELIRIVPDYEYDTYWLIFESEEWQPIQEGERIPMTHVKFTSHLKSEEVTE